MSGEIQILLLVLLSVAVGVAALICYLRKWERSSSAEPAPSPKDSTTLDRDATALPGKQEFPSAFESSSSEIAAITSHGSDAKVESVTVALEEHKDNAITDEPAPRTEAGPRPDERTSDGNLIHAPLTDVGNPPAAGHKERVAGSDREPDATPSQVESKMPTTPGMTETTKNGGPAVVYVVENLDASQDEQSGGQMAEDGEFDTEEDDNDLDVDLATITHLSQTNRVRKKKPRKYKGLARAAPRPRDVTMPAEQIGEEEPTQRDRSLPIEVRLRFDRGGFCSISLLPKRSPGLPENLTVVFPTGELTLRAMQDEWYQDVVPGDIFHVLQDGTVWTQEGSNGQHTWSLSGRTLYVLADRPDVSGYVSQPCLDLGRDHVVLCSESLRIQVEDAIRKTGAHPATVLDESFGAPHGWVVFRGVVPNSAVSPVGEADILNALRPLPRIEISLERGIRLGHANWLDGYPPSIHVYGDPGHAAEVHIDGQVASCGPDGAYRIPGWDSLGSHTVWCSGTSRSYSIVPFDASWDLWEAYAFPVAPGESLRLAICGPIVRAVSGEPCGAGDSVTVSETNPILLGPKPGQIVIATRASSLRGAPRIASPSFHPIWALPCDPLHCEKSTVRILFVAESDASKVPMEPCGGQNDIGLDIDSWCHFILDANRKGLKTDPNTESVQGLWLSYKRLARQIWRASR